MNTGITEEIREKLLVFQKNEITEYHIYTRLAQRITSEENSRVLKKIAHEELQHYRVWNSYTGQDVRPDRVKIWFYYLISMVFGFTFGIKLMERGEDTAQDSYHQLTGVIEEAEDIIREESEHEEALIQLLDEERLRYTGSMVLGLNDALVELTGALAGFTLALQDTKLIALTGSITGIAAALSMAASEYLSTKAEETDKNPLKASTYTGIAYIMTVLVLIMPYLILSNYYICLGLTLSAAVLIIAFFNYYISVAKDLPFTSRFVEMAGLSLSVAGISFLIGFLMRTILGVDI
ncbi:MAG TPA: VIT1/CCC1 transporter family protein [Deltaproteobacteria bacterium]|nr:VIT1/CCC1 transporter family protein [Deltaproteobacteria bacterium]